MAYPSTVVWSAAYSVTVGRSRLSPALWMFTVNVPEVPAGATIVYTHSLFPGWGRIVREASGYRWVGG